MHLHFILLREWLDPWLHRSLIAIALLLLFLSKLTPSWLYVPHWAKELFTVLSEQIEGLLIILAVVAGLGLLYRTMVRRFGRQARPTLSAFLNLPDFEADRRSTWKPRYLIRKVRRDSRNTGSPDPSDIAIFVDLASNEGPIVEAHPGLTIDERKELYEGWWRLNRNTFFILAIQENGLPEEIVAISIILPLTLHGAADLLSGKLSPIELGVGDIAPERRRPKSLLIDTWIVSKAHRFYQDKYRYSLLLKHLSEFWRIRTQGVEILAEPDTLQMARHLSRLGFQRQRLTGNSDLYRICIGDPTLPQAINDALKTIEDNILVTLKWPIAK